MGHQPRQRQPATTDRARFEGYTRVLFRWSSDRPQWAEGAGSHRGVCFFAAGAWHCRKLLQKSAIAPCVAFSSVWLSGSPDSNLEKNFSALFATEPFRPLVPRPEKNSEKITGDCRILGRAEASIIRFIPRGIFDDAATEVMGDAFDAACQARHRSGQPPIGYEVIARRIVEAARTGNAI